jgi:hypothetical protein
MMPEYGLSHQRSNGGRSFDCFWMRPGSHSFPCAPMPTVGDRSLGTAFSPEEKIHDPFKSAMWGSAASMVTGIGSDPIGMYASSVCLCIFVSRMANPAERVRATKPLPWFRVLRTTGLTVLWVVLALMTLWAVAALYVDLRVAVLRIPVSAIYVVAMIAILVKVKRPLRAAALCFAGFCIVLTWWLCLKPSNQGDWQADTARTASVEINGDRVTIHNLRNCAYRTETDYTNCWNDRTVYSSTTQTFSSPLGVQSISAIRLSASNSGITTIFHSQLRHAIKPARRTRRFLDSFASTS